MSDVENPAVGGDDLMSPHELLDDLDTDESGWIESDEFEKRDSFDKDLDKIRARRSGETRRFPRGIEDFVLIGGLIYGILFFGGTLAMSAGILGNSVVMDETLSDTFLDFENCTDPGDEVWLNAWIDDSHNIRIDAFNVPTEAIYTNISYSISDGSRAASLGMEATLENASTIKIDYSTWPDDLYNLHVEYTNRSVELLEETNLTTNETTITEVWTSKVMTQLDVHVEIKSRAPGMGWLPWVDNSPVKEAVIESDESRRCWTTSELGNWGWIMMGAEWGGGRETAMLAGGSAGVPPWWMAFVSMSMSVFFLFVQYPLMYRFYHTEDDDMLSESQLKRVIQLAIQKAEKTMRLEVDWETWKMQERDISIDVLVPYRTTMETHVDVQEIRGSMVTLVLDEFKAFGVMKPLHLQAKAVDSRKGVFESLEHGLDVTVEAQGERAELVDDYSKFFANVGVLAGVEYQAIKEVKKWFAASKRPRLIDRGSKVYSDDVALYVRIIYKPKQRFAFFRFKRSYVDVEADIENYMRRKMKDYLEDRELVVSARNEVQTLSDRSAAGRVETGGAEGKHQALVAKQGGIVGTLLQNQVMGDVLSTVEFVAQEKRDFINRWGFWGLIVFVWIPFMASGVLVGAMLGLLSRMKFTNVLIACAIGGFAASVTWAYTARGIIEVMERYHAEALIPWLIALVIAFAVFHLRTSKKRRREALFKETVQFFGGSSESES